MPVRRRRRDMKLLLAPWTACRRMLEPWQRRHDLLKQAEARLDQRREPRGRPGTPDDCLDRPDRAGFDPRREELLQRRGLNPILRRIAAAVRFDIADGLRRYRGIRICALQRRTI